MEERIVVKRKGEKSDLQVLSAIGEDTRLALRNVNATARVNQGIDSRSKKYSRKKPSNILNFNNGYDLLQYNIVVRPFIMKKFKIEKSLDLDVLVYLFPIQFFTMTDFNMLLTRNYNLRLKTLMDMGYVEKCIELRKGSKNIYTLSEHAVRIVREYYQYLSGEKKISQSPTSNPFRDVNATKADMAREKVMLRLKRQTETQPSLFRKNLYS